MSRALFNKLQCLLKQIFLIYLDLSIATFGKFISNLYISSLYFSIAVIDLHPIFILIIALAIKIRIISIL